MKIDFHSHILPKIDDGSRSVEESVKLLDLMAQDGVSVVAATPHFYCSKTSIHRFLDRRAEAYEKLKPAPRCFTTRRSLARTRLHDWHCRARISCCSKCPTRR